MDENKYFLKALSNFTQDVASGGAIRHLIDKGYTINEIMQELEFPTPYNMVQSIAWQHLLKQGIISCQLPSKDRDQERVRFVKENGPYGRTSFRKVVEKVEKSGEEEVKYYKCDFGKEQYKDKKAFEKKLDALNPKDKEFILGLPWPLEPVYYRADERMDRIALKLNLKAIKN